MARFNMTYHGSPSAQSIMSQGFRPGGIMSVAPGQVFSTPNYGFASGYGKPVGMVTSKGAFSMPSMNFSTGNFGSEVVQSPKAATRGMNLANKLGTTYTSSRAKDLMSGRTVSGLGGSTPGNLMRALGIMGSLPAQTALMSLSPTPANADEINMTAEDFANLANAEVTPQTYSNIPELTQLIDDNPDINSLAEAQEYANQNRPNMSDIAGLGDLGNPTGDSRVVSEEMGMTGTPNFGRPSMADIAGPINENLIDRGNPFNDSRIAPEERGLSGFPGLGQVDPGFQNVLDAREARRGQIEMQQNPDYGQFFDPAPLNEEKRGIDLGLLGLLAGPAGFLTGSNALRGIGLAANIASGRAGRALGAVGRGIGSLGSKFAGKMRGINPTTGRPNTQAQYEANRSARQTQSRIDNMLDRKAKGKSYSEKNLSDLIGKQIASRADKSGKGKKGGFTNPGKGSYGPHSGGGSDSGGGGKIVCTMMNNSYGFGSFRNKIWLKHSRDLPKEYEVGYHTIFLPLVKFAKGEGKLNKVVKKTLEHIAKHRTYDLKQEMKGKTHLLGRAYRKVLEPICYIVGKASMFTRRG